MPTGLMLLEVTQPRCLSQLKWDSISKAFVQAAKSCLPMENVFQKGVASSMHTAFLKLEGMHGLQIHRTSKQYEMFLLPMLFLTKLFLQGSSFKRSQWWTREDKVVLSRGWNSMHRRSWVLRKGSTIGHVYPNIILPGLLLKVEEHVCISKILSLQTVID